MTNNNQKTLEKTVQFDSPFNEKQNSQVHMNFTSSGFEQFDKTFGGFKENGVTVIARRPGMGATVFMINSAVEKVKKGSNVIFLSKDLNSLSFYQRLLSKLTQIPLLKIIQPELLTTEQRWKLQGLKEKNTSFMNDNFQFFEINDSTEIKQLIKTYKLLHDVDTVFLDSCYLEKDNIKDLIQFADEEKVSIVMSQQLNRNIETRGNKRPVSKDLFDLEVFKNDVSFYGIYRDEVYNFDTEHLDTMEVFSLHSDEPQTVRLKINLSIQTIYNS